MSCDKFPFQFGIWVRVCTLFVLIPDHCHLIYFFYMKMTNKLRICMYTCSSNTFQIFPLELQQHTRQTCLRKNHRPYFECQTSSHSMHNFLLPCNEEFEQTFIKSNPQSADVLLRLFCLLWAVSEFNCGCKYWISKNQTDHRIRYIAIFNLIYKYL